MVIALQTQKLQCFACRPRGRETQLLERVQPRRGDDGKNGGRTAVLRSSEPATISPDSEASEPTATATAIATATPEVSTPEPTATEVAPTETPLPTETPTATPTSPTVRSQRIKVEIEDDICEGVTSYPSAYAFHDNYHSPAYDTYDDPL